MFNRTVGLKDSWAKLEAKQLKPVADADRVTLIRRVTFDLIGSSDPTITFDLRGPGGTTLFANAALMTSGLVSMHSSTSANA